VTARRRDAIVPFTARAVSEPPFPKVTLSHVVRTDAPPPQDSLPESGPRYVAGEIIADKYRLIRRLGEGGMGSVWVARNLALDAQVAIKLMRRDVETPGAAERLLNEARATARLKHPSVVRIFDFGRTRRDDPFIVMELLTGENLGDVLEREGRLPSTHAVQLLLPIADGLHAAHAKGIIHRDLKPENIFLAEGDGRVQPKVLDFGIARLDRVDDHRLTQAGTVLGSPDYMAPEQARGLDDIDHRADLWAFCVVLYECLTGRVPFEDANYNALLRHIIEDPIPATLEFAAGDIELWAILERGFSKDREERWRDMRQLSRALAHWLVAHGVTEDVCGQSLRAAWLDSGRLSIPDGMLFRSSLHELDGRSSTADSAKSGPRRIDEALVRVSLPTLAPPPSLIPSSQPPVTAALSTEPPARAGRARYVVLGVAAAVLLVASAVAATLALSRQSADVAELPSARPVVAAPALDSTSRVEATTGAHRQPPAAVEPSATTVEIEQREAPRDKPPAARTEATQRRAVKTESAGRKPSASATAADPAPKPSAPQGAYGEDLGF
jgi:serine/threonine protein kinase